MDPRLHNRSVQSISISASAAQWGSSLSLFEMDNFGRAVPVMGPNGQSVQILRRGPAQFITFDLASRWNNQGAELDKLILHVDGNATFIASISVRFNSNPLPPPTQGIVTQAINQNYSGHNELPLNQLFRQDPRLLNRSIESISVSASAGQWGSSISLFEMDNFGRAVPVMGPNGQEAQAVAMGPAQTITFVIHNNWNNQGTGLDKLLLHVDGNQTFIYSISVQFHP